MNSTINYAKYKYIGKKFQLKDNSLVEIIDYHTYKNIDVKLETGEILYGIYLSQIKKGLLRNPYKRNVFDRGYVGVGKYRTDNVFYKIWYKMFYRCYSPDKYKTYEFCEVVPEWYNFQTFAEWCSKNYVDGFALDKDILFTGNKLYGPDTCCFVPQEINNQFYSNNYNHEIFGVRKITDNIYRPRMKKYGKEIYLGSYHNKKDALNVYFKTKESYIHELAEKYKSVLSDKVYNRLLSFTLNIEDYNII